MTTLTGSRQGGVMKKLPDETAVFLRSLYVKRHKKDRWSGALLDAYIVKLRQAGWPLQSIANEIGITAEGVRRRGLEATQKAFDSPELPDAPPLPVKPLPPRKIRRPELRPEFKQWLRERHALAKECRGWHELGSPERTASEQLWAAIAKAVAQGVQLPRFAEVLGVSNITIRMGLARHGHRRNPPSQQAYRGIFLDISKGGPGSKKRDFCKMGHALIESNLYINKAGRTCATCARRRARERYRQRLARAA